MYKQYLLRFELSSSHGIPLNVLKPIQLCTYMCYSCNCAYISQQPHVQVGKDCFLSGISDALIPATDVLTTQKLVIPDRMALQEVLISVGLGKIINHMGVLIVYGVDDDLHVSLPSNQFSKPLFLMRVLNDYVSPQLHLSSPDLTFCNEKWSVFLERTGITVEDLWQSGFVC